MEEEGKGRINWKKGIGQREQEIGKRGNRRNTEQGKMQGVEKRGNEIRIII